MLIQILLWFVLLAALGMTWKRARQSAIRRGEALVWSFVWIAAGVLVWRPEVASLAARLVGVGRGADLVLYAAVIALLVLVFRLHILHDRLERELTELVRTQALHDFSRTSSSRPPEPPSSQSV